MFTTFAVTLACCVNIIHSDSTVAFRHYYTNSGEHTSAKDYLVQYINSIKKSHFNLNNTLSIVTPSNKGAPYIDTDNKHPSIPGFRANPVWETIEPSNITENLPLEVNLHTHGNLHGTVTDRNEVDYQAFPLSDESFHPTILNYNKEDIPKCPEGLILHQTTIDNKISCYKITDPTTFPPPCPYPLNMDYFLFKNIYNEELTNKIVWAFAKKNTYNGAYEWINYIHNSTIISKSRNPFTRMTRKDCMIINRTELVPVNCQEKYSGICIYNFDFSLADDYCKRKLKTHCFSSNLGVTDKCNCIETQNISSPSRNSFCNKLVEVRDPYQNLILTNHLKENQFCWFGLTKHNWISDNALIKYSFWYDAIDFTKNYGAVSRDGWILEDDRKLNCAICESNVIDYKNVGLHLKHNFTSNKVQLEIYNPIDTFQGVICFSGSKTHVFNLENSTDQYLLTDVWSYDQITEDSWCKTLQMPKMDLIYSNRILGNRKNGNIFAVIWSFSVTTWDSYEKSCPVINNGIIKRIELIKVLEFKEENKIKLLCHLYTIASGFNISEDYKILENLLVIENMGLESVASVKVCLPSETMSSVGTLHWPEANIGSTVVADEICMQDGDSPVTRTCGGDHESGAHWLPVNGSCAEISIPPTTTFLNELLHSSPSVNNDITKDLSVFTENKTNLNTFQIHLVSQILENIAGYDNISLKDVVSTVNNIMQFEPRNLRGSQVLLNSTDIILWSLDEILFHVDTNSDTSGYISEGSEKLLIQATNFMKTDIWGFSLHSSDTTNFDTGALEPLHQHLREDELEDDLDLVLIIPQDLRNDIVRCSGSKDAPNMITSIFYNDVLFNENDNATGKSDGKIISVLLPGFNCSFSSPIQIIFKSNAPLGLEVKCASWVYGANEFMESIHGRWSLEASPKNVGNSSKYKLCEFSHTTHFALLILDENRNISEGHKKALDVITAVGSALSILGLLAIFLTAILFKSYRTTNGVVINFSLAMTAQIVFLFVAGSVADDKTLCTIFGAFLHYSVLSEFFWMLTIAVLQYQRYVIIFSSPPTHLLAKSCLFAWGVPLIPVIVIVSISTDNYGPNTYGFCYTLGNYFTFGVIVPVSLIILVNLMIFLRIMVSIVTSRRIKVHQDKGQASVLQLRLAFMLFFLLGLTWGFGLFANFGGGLAYSYLFCLTATLQGFVLFLFFIVLNEKTRSLWINMKTCWRKSDDYDVNRDSASSVMMRRNKTVSTETCTDSATSDTVRKARDRRTSEF